ncbi:uncharacterized protein lig isoform X2 [Lepeophtheirus salmonis]|uniref:uncharacterized protein lig isoform X2 n=1 Tax=Lepeophtheirus salmonis TaxID=72036 RepID=UPI001AE1E0E0|nr:protein lingerer-like isoform X2 [Lepeophtheirus salmonis]
MPNKSRKGVKNKEKSSSHTGNSEVSKSGKSTKKNPTTREDGGMGSGLLGSEETPRLCSPQPQVSTSPGVESLSWSRGKEVVVGGERVKREIHATSEQMMIAQLIHHEDPKHKLKIQNVMDITNKEEDEVATALFDSAWDESKAIELLLDVNGGARDGFGEWEETGKRKKRNKQSLLVHEDNKHHVGLGGASLADDWDESGGGGSGEHPSNNQASDSNREKSRQRGPPRMRRGGGSNAGGRGGGRGGGMADRSSYNNNNYNDNGATDGEGLSNNNNYHQSGQRSRGQPPRRGGGGRGGDRGGRNNHNYQPRYDRSNQGNSGGHSGNQGGSSQAFSGSIDTWNPSGENSEQTTSKKSRNNNKDAFDNAGNWGDDFPAAEDWDNEEYTGSLADTKVFTAKSTGGSKMPTAVGQNRGPSAAQTSQHSPQQSQSQTSQGSSSNAASSSQQQQPQQPSTYSQSIDLSTLLQKPATQSSLTNPPNILQFQQHASDSLKSVVGLSSTSSQSVATSSQAQGSTPGNTSTKGDLYYGSSNQQSGGSYSALIKSGTVGNKSHVISNKSRLPPPSKIPSSAVEMPGDSLTKLDVQFGGLDLQFGAPTSTGDSSVSGTNGGFDFGGTSNTSGSSSATGESSKYLGGGSDKSKLDVYSSSAPSAKEVTKSLASKIDSSIGFDRSSKSSSSTSNKPSAAYKSQEVINNYNSSSNPPYSSYPNQPSQQGSVQQQTSIKNYPPGASSNFNQYSQYSNQSNGSYANNGIQQQQPYSQANSASYNNVSGSSSSSSVTSNYPSSSNVTTANYNNYNSVSSNSASSNSAQQSYGSSKGSTYEPTSSLKYDTPPSVSTSAMQNSIGVPGGSTATALGLTSTTNALSGKISATSASKVNLSNFPPGVASMLPTQYMIGNAQAGMPPFYGLQQHMYSTYNASTASGIEELAALQRGAAAAGLHTLVGSAATGGAPPPPVVGSTTSGPIAAQGQHSATGKPTTGYYDPNSQFATSLAAATSGGSRTDGNASISAGSNSMNSLNDKNFGGNNNSVGGNESTSSPIPSSLASAVAAATTPAAAQAAAQAAAAAQQQQQQPFSLNTFAPQHQAAIPAPYAYYFGPGLQAYGSGVYPAGPMNVVPTGAGGNASTQFQKTGYGSSYASAYDNLGQQVNKEFNPTYSSGTGNNKVAAGGVAAGSSSTAPGKGNHQYWNNATNHLSSQLWG